MQVITAVSTAHIFPELVGFPFGQVEFAFEAAVPIGIKKKKPIICDG